VLFIKSIVLISAFVSFTAAALGFCNHAEYPFDFPLWRAMVWFMGFLALLGVGAVL
jgi:hypothetical protein